MLYFYNGNSKDPGIYEIRNRHTNRSYIGQASRFQERWIEGHKSSLLRNAHRNPFLQRDFNKCKEILGHDDFLEFHIIQTMPKSTPEKRDTKELYWIAKYKKAGIKLYNLIEEESGNYIFSEETRQKMSETKKLQWQNHDYSVFMSEAHRGYKASNETKEKMSKSHKGLNTWSKGRSNSSKGKTRPGCTGLKHPKAKIYENINLQSPNGSLYTKIECAAEFARLNRLNIKNLNQLLNGKRKSHKGWRLLTSNLVEDNQSTALLTNLLNNKLGSC
jgi:group I intron endonuclease